MSEGAPVSRDSRPPDHSDTGPPWERAREFVSNPLGREDDEVEREVEETHEIVYGPDGRTPEAERKKRTIHITRDPFPSALEIFAEWIFRLLGTVVVCFLALAVALHLARMSAPLWAWLLPALALLVAAPFAVLAWRED